MSLEAYLDAVRRRDFAAAAAAGDAVLAEGWPSYATLEALRRPAAGEGDALEAGTAAFLKASRRSPWASFFRRWALNQAERPGRRAETAANAKRLRAASVPEWGWMRAELGKDHLALGLFKEAEKDFRAALTYDPGDWRARMLLAESLLAQRRKRDAFACASRALEEAGDLRGDALAWAGELDLWAGRRKEARARLKEAAALGAERAHCWMAGLLVGDKRYEEALTSAALALKKSGKDAEARVWRAEALLRLGRAEDALAETAAAGEDAGPPFALWLGVMKTLALDALGRRTEAEHAFRSLPAAPFAFAARRLKGEPTPAALCERLLRLAGGVRRDGYERAFWMREAGGGGERVGDRYAPLNERIARADALLNAERFEEADALIASLRRSNRHDHDVLLLEGRRLRRHKDPRSAAKVFAKAKPGLPVGLHLAESLARAGLTEKAVEALRRALKAARSPSPLDVHVAAVYAGEFEKAVKAGETVLDSTRAYEDLRRLTWPSLQLDYRREPQPPELLDAVLANVAAYRKRKPDCPWGRYWEFYFSEEALRPADAAAASAKAREAGPLYAWMRYQTGKARFFSGDFEGAEQDFQAAAGSCEPANWRALMFRAETLWCLRRPAAAWQAAFEEAEAVTPAAERLGLRGWKGELLLWTGQYEQALALLQEAAKQGPCDASLWEGACLTLLGKPELALPKLDAALARSPRRGDALLWRAETLHRLGRRSDALMAAEKAFRHAESERPNFYARVIRGLCRQASGDTQGAKAEWDSLPEKARSFGDFETLLAASKGVRDGLRCGAVL